MIKIYLKTALRSIKRNKLYSFINITGLSIGMACCMLIFLYIQFELSYDRYNKKADRIYRLVEILHMPKGNNVRAVSSGIMAPTLQDNLPEVLKTVRINYSERTLSYRETKVNETRLIYADSTLFDVFTFPMIQGNPHQALVKPYSIVLTESAAKKYFGNVSAIGKVMKLSDTINLTVTGVIKDVPINSHFTFDCVLSRSTIFELSNHEKEDNWFNNNYYTYLLLGPNSSFHSLEPKINSVIEKAMKQARKATGLWYDFKLQPLTVIHLHSDLNFEISPNSDIRYIYIFSAVAILILLIACGNFINLSTAGASKRSKEIGLRKIIGAKRWQLIVQFFGESFLFTIIASALAIVLVMIALPYFNEFTGKNLSLNYLDNSVLTYTYFGIVLTVGLLAGAYPALFLSSFGSIKALKGDLKNGWQDILIRKGLVVFQFTIAIILIAGTTLVFRQMQFIQNQKLGLNKDQVLEIAIQNKDISKGGMILDEIRKNSFVTNASLTSFSFRDVIPSIAMLPEGAGGNEVSSQNTIAVDENFLPAFQIPLVAGRNFSKSFATDATSGFIVNETAVKSFGWKNPEQALGKNIDWGLGKRGKVIGVVKDFNFSSLHDNIKPLIIQILPDWNNYVAVRIKPQNIEGSISQLQKTWQHNAMSNQFTYSFLDDDFANLYKSEQNMQSVLGLFTFLSVFLSCLGIFGLASFTVKQRVKEIGVRKVLGARTSNITVLLSKEFLKLVALAVVIASPIAYFIIHKWLQGFAYQVNISLWLFLVTGACAILIAFITVSFQSFSAAISSPVKNLNNE